MSEIERIERLEREQQLQFRELTARITKLRTMLGVLAVVAIGLGVANYVLAMHEIPEEFSLKNAGWEMKLAPSGIQLSTSTHSASFDARALAFDSKTAENHPTYDARLGGQGLRLRSNTTHVTLEAHPNHAALRGTLSDMNGFTLEASATSGSFNVRGGGGRASLDTAPDTGGFEMWIKGKSQVSLPAKAEPTPAPTTPTKPAPKTP